MIPRTSIYFMFFFFGLWLSFPLFVAVAQPIKAIRNVRSSGLSLSSPLLPSLSLTWVAHFSF